MRIATALVVLTAVACGVAPGAGGPLTVPELKFAVIDTAGKPAWCDPDFWPLAHPEEPNAIAKYPEIKADAVTYAAIVAHEHLPPGELTDAQKLTLYRAWKLLIPLNLTRSGLDYTFDYETVTPTDYVQVAGTVTAAGKVNITRRTAAVRPNCPICLAASTMIETPNGPVRVVDVRPGMVVWTQDASGARIAASVTKVGNMVAPPGHRMVHLVLADGRELLASPGHLTADKTALGDLRVGDVLDGSPITRRELVPYGDNRTYDLLPAGPTGRYWANGIVLASTLA